MICEVCKKNRIDRIIKESKNAMKRFNEKLKEENICHTQVSKKEIDSREK